MDSFNKVLSFILGLVVVLVFIIVLSNRLHWGDRFLPFQGKKITPTPTVKVMKPTPTPTVVFTYPGGGTKGGIHPTAVPMQTKGGNPASIPSTGSPTELLAAISALGALGVYLRKKKV